MESTWKKKKGEQTKKGELNSLTFQTHLSFTLYTHTHTTKKHFKSCPNLCKLLAECVFLFVFFSLRIVTLTGTRRANFVLGKNGYNYIACVCRRRLHQNRSIDSKKREILTRTRRRYIFQNAFKTDRNAFLDVFCARLHGFTRNTISRDAIRARKRGDRSQASFLCFSRMQSSSAFGGTLDTFFQKKEKKNSNPFTSSFSHTKNIICDS